MRAVLFLSAIGSLYLVDVGRKFMFLGDVLLSVALQ